MDLRPCAATLEHRARTVVCCPVGVRYARTVSEDRGNRGFRLTGQETTTRSVDQRSLIF